MRTFINTVCILAVSLAGYQALEGYIRHVQETEYNRGLEDGVVRCYYAHRDCLLEQSPHRERIEMILAARKYERDGR